MKVLLLIAGLLVIGGIILISLSVSNEQFCCGDKSYRRIDVVYPPDIYIGARGPFNAYTRFSNPWKNERYDQAFVEQRLSNPNRVVFLDN